MDAETSIVRHDRAVDQHLHRTDAPVGPDAVVVVGGQRAALDRGADRAAVARAGEDTGGIGVQLRAIEHDFRVPGTRWSDIEAWAGVLADRAVGHDQPRGDTGRRGEVKARAETGDAAVLEVQDAAVEEVHASPSASGALDAQSSQNDCDIGRRDGDAVGSECREYPATRAGTVDGNRFGDRDGAEAVGIDTIDEAARNSPREGCGERLARRRAAARIDVVAS